MIMSISDSQRAFSDHHCPRHLLTWNQWPSPQPILRFFVQILLPLSMAPHSIPNNFYVTIYQYREAQEMPMVVYEDWLQRYRKTNLAKGSEIAAGDCHLSETGTTICCMEARWGGNTDPGVSILDTQSLV